MKIIAHKIQPCLFDDMSGIKVSFKPSKTPHVYLCVQPGREEEYGLNIVEKVAQLVPEVKFHIYGVKSKEGYTYKKYILEDGRETVITYHGKIPNEQFNKEIKGYQAALRMNEFDGASEVLMKSILMGQYPISRIPYPKGIDSYQTTEELVVLLKDLKNKKQPNPEVRKWRTILQ